MYAVAARIQGAEVRECRCCATRLRARRRGRARRLRRQHAKLVFLCSPNNPTGNADGSRRDRAAASSTLAGTRAGGGRRGVHRIRRRPSLAAASLARLPESRRPAHAVEGASASPARACGSLIAQPEIIALLRKVIPPYPFRSSRSKRCSRRCSPPQLPSCNASASRRCAPSASALSRRWRASKSVQQASGPASRTSCWSTSPMPESRWPRARDAKLLIRDVRSRVARTACASRVGTPEQNDRLIRSLAMSTSRVSVRRSRRHADRGAARRAGGFASRRSASCPACSRRLRQAQTAGFSS